jgi:hypothetical protein
MRTQLIERTGLGLLTAILIGTAFDLAPSVFPGSWAHERLFGFFYVWTGVEGACVMFLAALGGAYVARVPFIGAAVLLAVGSWMLTVYLLTSITAVSGQGDILVVAGSNILGLLLGVGGAAAGAYLGGSLSRRNAERAANAA